LHLLLLLLLLLSTEKREAAPWHPTPEPRRPEQKTACFQKAITQAAEDVETIACMRSTP